MSSVVSESPILNVPDPRRIGPSPDEIVIRAGTFDTLTVGTINGGVISGEIVSTNAVQTLTNKTISILGVFTQDGNHTTRTSGTISTTDATPTTLISIATTTNTSYYICVKASAADSTGGANSGTYKTSAKVKNLAGVLSISSAFDTATALDGTLGTTSITFTSSGTNLLIQANGLAATTIKWFAVAEAIAVGF